MQCARHVAEIRDRVWKDLRPRVASSACRLLPCMHLLLCVFCACFFVLLLVRCFLFFLALFFNIAFLNFLARLRFVVLANEG